MKKYFLSLFTLFALGLCLAACTKHKEAVSPTPSPKGAIEGGKVMVELETSMGKIVLELDSAKAPKTVANFLEYANAGFYNGTIFHRVIEGFMIQGGGFDSSLKQKETRSPIPNEASNGLSNGKMTVAMARTNDPNSATAQFFINLVDNRRLDAVSGMSAGYAVFGKVVEGEDVVKKIGEVPTTTKTMYENVPVTPVTIQKVTVR